MDLESGHGHSRCTGLQSWGPCVMANGTVVRTGMVESFLKITYLFICLCWVLIAACGIFFFFLVAV